MLAILSLRNAVAFQTLAWLAMGLYTALVDSTVFFTNVGHFGLPPHLLKESSLAAAWGAMFVVAGLTGAAALLSPATAQRRWLMVVIVEKLLTALNGLRFGDKIGGSQLVVSNAGLALIIGIVLWLDTSQ